MLLATLPGCRQILGIEEASLICPPDIPDCKLCQDAKDCGPSTECHSWACTDNQCVPVNAPARTKCATGVCSDDPVSECVECMAYEDCPGGQCRDRVCSRCDDGIQNGWESGVDCGGGGPCKRCLGDPCASADQCQSGFCTDGTCCNTECGMMCAACYFPDPGNCSALPLYMDDNEPDCDGMYTCNGSGLCLLRPTEICVSAVECASGRCEQSRCRRHPGESCFSVLECAENSCVNGICQK